MDEPGRIARLPHYRTRPVPWFVAWFDGVPDFRVVKPNAAKTAISQRICWVCGIRFARQEQRAFVVGPMCAVNRISAEPPAHYECAVYSARVCPFLAHPNMTRRERHLPEGTVLPPGTMIKRNPGVVLVWVTRYTAWWVITDGQGGMLFEIGTDPDRVEWYAEGRPATRAEVLHSIETGLPALAQTCGPRDLARLEEGHTAALALIPR